MKNVFYFSAIVLLVLSGLSCHQSATPGPDVDPVVNTAYFNQQKTVFRGSQTQKLLDFWYARRSNDLVEYALINDAAAYQKFFGQSSADSLPAIDFSQYSLLIGSRGRYGEFQDGPANIRMIQQSVQEQADGKLVHTVTVSAKNRGEEWFGFSVLVPHIANPELVKLTIQYKYD